MPAKRSALAPALVLLAFALPAFAAGPPVPPSPTAYVTDGAGVLSAEARSRLEARLAGFEDETSNQVLVWTAPRIPEGTTLEEFAVEAFRAWKVGQRDKKNGVVFFVFPEDHAARIEVGYGLEGALPDALAGRILNDEVFPLFRAGNFAAGISAGVDAILAATKGEYRGTGARRKGARREAFPWPLLFFLLFFVLPALFGRRRRSYWWLGGGGFGSGGFGGGWGGGGFGGFSGGGGMSGGGGASGRW